MKLPRFIRSPWALTGFLVFEFVISMQIASLDYRARGGGYSLLFEPGYFASRQVRRWVPLSQKQSDFVFISSNLVFYGIAGLLAGGLISRYFSVKENSFVCTECGHNLTGKTSGVCPECGKAIEPQRNVHGSE